MRSVQFCTLIDSYVLLCTTIGLTRFLLQEASHTCVLSFKSTPRYVTLHLVKDSIYALSVFKLLLLQLCKYDIEQSISREMSGDLKAGMLTIGWFYSLNRNIISKIKLFLSFGLYICKMQTNVSRSYSF